MEWRKQVKRPEPVPPSASSKTNERDEFCQGLSMDHLGGGYLAYPEKIRLSRVCERKWKNCMNASGKNSRRICQRFLCICWDTWKSMMTKIWPCTLLISSIVQESSLLLKISQKKEPYFYCLQLAVRPRLPSSQDTTCLLFPVEDLWFLDKWCNTHSMWLNFRKITSKICYTQYTPKRQVVNRILIAKRRSVKYFDILLKKSMQPPSHSWFL